MKKRIVLSIFVGVLFLGGCAGMPMQDQRNMGFNAAIWGGIGAVTGAALSAVTGGNPVGGAIIGGLAGAGIGAMNTPTAGSNYYGSGNVGYGYGPYAQTYNQEVQRLQQEEYWRWEQAERERARNDARNNYYRR